MKRFLTTGFLGAILGIVIGGVPADASLISRGFLDEVLTDYATTTALDLKADQTDLTALSNIVAKSAWNTENAALDFSSFPFTNEFGFKSTGSWVNNTRGIADMLGQYNANTAFPGLAGVTYKLTNGWTSDVGIGVRFEKYNQYNPGLEGMFNGWTIYDPSGSEIMVYKGLENISSQIRTIEDTYHTGLSRLLVNGENKINVEAYNYTGPIYPIWKLSEGIDKIGTLPDGITVQGMYEGWTDSRGNYLPGLYNLSKSETLLLNAYNSDSAYLLIQGAKATTIDGVDYTGPIYPIWKLSEEVAKLTFPEGIDVSGVVAHELFGADQPNSLPKTVTEAIQVLFNCNGSPGSSAACFPYMANNILFGRTLSNSFIDTYKQQFPGLTGFKGLLHLTSDIGTLPSGTLMGAGGGIADSFYKIAQQNSAPLYPTSMEEFVLQIYGEVGKTGGIVPMLLDNINYAKSSASSASSKATTAQTAADNAKAAADANTAKIGTLPDGYDSVGAALTAIDAKIDARELPSTSADGQYVLSAKKVGDTITYTWVKMDLTSEEQAQ